MSRGGAYFHSHQNYEPGDDLKVVLPYEDGQMEIKLPAQVVRVDRLKSPNLRGIAIRIDADWRS